MGISIVANCVPAISMLFGGIMILGGDPNGWWLVGLGGVLQFFWLYKK